MSQRYDVAVVGVGAAGSAALYELARRGVRAIGIEQFEPSHDRGSSHGESRIIRLSYFEHPSYVPMLLEARRRWIALDRENNGEDVFLETGSLEVGYPGSPMVSRSLEASRLHDLEVVEMDAGEIARRYPAFQLPKNWRGHFQPQGGLLKPEAAIQRYANLAVQSGARLLTHTPVRRITSHPAGVQIHMDREQIVADALIVTAGAWLKQLLPGIRMDLTLSRQVVGWFEAGKSVVFKPDRLPVFLVFAEDDAYYGFPDFAGSGFKAASHIVGETLDRADDLEQDAGLNDEIRIRHLLERYMPEGNGRCLKLQTCMYTNTPDGHFLIDRAADDPRIVIASACSGHGFKFIPVLGEILADMAENKTPRFPIEGFSQDLSRRLPPAPHLA